MIWGERMNKKDTCEIYCFDEEKVNRIQDDLKTVDLSSAVQLFKAIADENRAKVVYALCKADELCVCDVANIINVTVANASHHLRTLHKQGIVNFQKKGKMAFYSLSDERIKQLILFTLAEKWEAKANV